MVLINWIISEKYLSLCLAMYRTDRQAIYHHNVHELYQHQAGHIFT